MSTPDAFAALSNPIRRRILELIREAPRAAGAIAAEFALGRPAVSEHLQVLRDAGLIRDEAQGRQRIYHLNPEGLGPVQDWLRPFERYRRERSAAVEEPLNEEAG